MINRYIYVDKNIITKKSTPKTIYTWIPVQIIKFKECRPKDIYVVDCFFRTQIENPYVSLTLMRKLPRNINIVDQSSMNFKKIVCECKDIVFDFMSIAKDVVTKNYDKLYNLLDLISEYKDVEIISRFFLRTRRYVIKAEQIKKMDRKIAVKITEKLMDRICFYNKKENREQFTPIEIERVYALMYIDPILNISGLIVNKKFIEIKTYIKFIKKLNLENQFFLKSQELSLNKNH